MRRTVATRACFRAQHRVYAFRNIGGFLCMARRAFYFRNVRGVREFLDARVAIGASQGRVHARLVLRFVDKDAAAGIRFQVLLAVAGEALRVGILGALA